MTQPPSPQRHSRLEDAQAFLLGTAMCALGVHFLTHLGLITGQTAGLAVLLSYLTGQNFGAMFFMVSLPFYLLAWLRMGAGFTIKSFVAVGLVSVMAELIPAHFVIERLDPVLGAMMAGAVIGLGLVVLFRHGASLGGIGVLALYIQDRLGIQAGWIQLGFDAVLFATALIALENQLVIYSALGAVIVNLIVAVNHRKDRYIAW